VESSDRVTSGSGGDTGISPAAGGGLAHDRSRAMRPCIRCGT
jgi:hypothetical protein